MKAGIGGGDDEAVMMWRMTWWRGEEAVVVEVMIHEMNKVIGNRMRGAGGMEVVVEMRNEVMVVRKHEIRNVVTREKIKRAGGTAEVVAKGTRNEESGKGAKDRRGRRGREGGMEGRGGGGGGED